MFIHHSAFHPRQPGVADINTNLAQFLIDEAVLEEPVINRAQRAASSTGDRLDVVLAKLGLINETDFAHALSRFLGLALVGNGDAPSEPLLTDVITPAFARQHRLMPLIDREDAIVIGVTDPFHEDPLRAIAYLLGKPIEARLFTPSGFDKTYQAIYQTADLAHDGDHALSVDASEVDIERLRDLASEAPIIKLVNDIINEAVEMQASDIHFEPQIDRLLVRYRIDGALIEGRTLGMNLRASVTSRVKLVAGLDIAERRMPQDGRIKIAVRGSNIDFRVSTTPTAFGESVVLRILDRTRVELDFARLGFSPAMTGSLETLLHEPNGIILVTGPTGSGKTTTLYTMFKALNQPDRKLFTVEDPIEYQLEGINQIQIHPEIGLDFPHALRSILRQDPDIIMIGEIRDIETAQIAIQASLTGHLVFSTLHTNSAAASLTRLLDMGVESYLLASTLRAVLAQRLIRRLCRHCSEPHAEADVWKAEIGGILEPDTPADIRQARGCDACKTTGYSGRTTIAEFMPVGHDIQPLILAQKTDLDITEAARRAGMRNLYENGLDKVWRGETTIDEVLRATRVI